ncbi:MAG: S-layer protein [Pirellulaceae bacterium]|nr:MAG: S-layer protein [Pirellulaceae bacterium]
MKKITQLVVLGALLLMVPAAAVAAESFAVLPSRIDLDCVGAEQMILVHRQTPRGLGAPITEGLLLSTEDPAVAVVEGTTVRAVSPGRTHLVVQHAHETSYVEVEVHKGRDRFSRPTFRNDVEPILAKAGCNSGACHGALAGKGGFKLTLRGYDPQTDYQNIARQHQGRRLELADPGRSLILAKPTGLLPHKGGIRFDPGSLEYQILAAWIASGAPPPTDEDPVVQRIELLPDDVELNKDQEVRFLVRAYYSDGTVRDVTRWAKFSSADESIALVSDDGHAQVVGSGRGAITAWFASHIAVARVTAPYPQEIPPEVFAAAPRHNFIDELVLKQLERLRLPPSPPVDDARFLRRAYLDTIGVLPTPEEVEAFLADPSPTKRDRVIEQLLNRPEFVDYWSYKWSDVLLVNGQLLRPEAVRAFYSWIRRQVAHDTPWDAFVRAILTAQGSTFENGAANFYALHQDPESMTENACQAFLSLSIACARCHNHPLEKWTNNQYYAMANLFARVRCKGWGGDPRSGDGLRVVYTVDHGELIQPLTGKPQPPTPLDGEPLPFDTPQDRRLYLADWMTSPSNPYFARAITNRVWANFFGVGLVEPVDDLRITNPAPNEELLSACADFLVQHNFDLKSLMRVILQSATYQRSSLALPENQQERRYYSRYYPRRLMAEVLHDAIVQVTEVPTEFTEVAYPGADRQKTDFYPKGTKAIQLYDSAVYSYFLDKFGRNQRMITCECERSNEPTLVQALHLSNGETLNEKLRAPGNRIDRWLAAGLSNEELVRQAYLVTVCRPPAEQETQQLVAILEQVPPEERRAAVEDLLWSLMTSPEFLFQH